MKKVKVINALCELGQKQIGVIKGPNAILSGLKHNNYNNFSVSEIRHFNNSNSKSYNTLNRCVYKSLEHFNKTCILGGDHSITSASLPAFFDIYKDDAHVLWFDAHADINTPKSSKTGNTHGMPLSKVFNLAKNEVFSNFKPNFGQLTYVGLRSIDEFENRVINDNKIKTFNSEEINFNMNSSLDKILDIVKDKKIYISIDVDCLDPTFFPCTGTKSNNGLHLTPFFKLIKLINKKSDVRCFDIVEFNPNLGTNTDLLRCQNICADLFHTLSE